MPRFDAPYLDRPEVNDESTRHDGGAWVVSGHVTYRVKEGPKTIVEFKLPFKDCRSPLEATQQTEQALVEVARAVLARLAPTTG